MTANYQIWLIAALVLICIDVFVILRLILRKLYRLREYSFSKSQSNELILVASGEKDTCSKSINMVTYFKFWKTAIFDDIAMKRLKKCLNTRLIESRYIKQLNSFSKTSKAEAASYLAALGTENARIALQKSLKKEKNSTVKLYLANALADIGNKKSLPVLIGSLLKENKFYRSKVNMLIADFNEEFHNYLPQIIDSEFPEYKDLIIDFSYGYVSEELKSYLIQFIDTREDALKAIGTKFGKYKKCSNCIFSSDTNDKKALSCKFKGVVQSAFLCRRYKVLPASINVEDFYKSLVLKACNVLAVYYPKELAQAKYLSAEDVAIRNIAIKALANFQSTDKLENLLEFLKEEATAKVAASTISDLAEMNPLYIKQIVKVFLCEDKKETKIELAKVLSLKIEYFIMKLNGYDKEDSKRIIQEILSLGRTSEVIDFLNKNKDIDLENELVDVIKKSIIRAENIKHDFIEYLNENVLLKCDLKKLQAVVNKGPALKEKSSNKGLILILAASFLIVPVTYIIRHFDILTETPYLTLLEIFVLDFNFYIGYYAITINAIYLILLGLSYLSVRKQARMWEIKTDSFLFKKRILPSVSIIAPAFNEQKTIIESVNSLLNLKYPDYELIVVNDGSSDDTLNVLVRYFDLKRVDYLADIRITTKPIRSVYLNRSLPKLIVVDKMNGGKADSLNVGINIANKEYICGIDADSLLEDDALLKLASLTLDEKIETPALGGNILPINGCKVERGKIIEKRLPKNRLAKLQTMEYIRSFMAGRLGWSYINCLLIISGAFGLFRKERIINIGGYLTSSGIYHKDTVGEDMELVVRIAKKMKEEKQEFRILYAYNANCWTEVPEDLKSLKKQRYRWHRGLIEILTYHKNMISNPLYGKVGLIAMPYFSIFEMLGPLFEIQGYAMVVAAFFLGLLNIEIALLLFVSSVLMGILISTASLHIAEKNDNYFSTRELLLLILYATVENFGIRQYFNIWRFKGFTNMLKKPAGWQKLERKGFS